MKYACLAAIAVMLCGSALAEPPKAVLIGPTGGLPGDILLLDATETTAKDFTWRVVPDDAKPTILVLEGGRKCLVRSVPGTYSVFFAASNSDGIDSLIHTITVSPSTPPVPPKPAPAPPGPAPTPPPSPPPGPNPTPEPVFPPGEFGAAAKVYQLAMSVQSPTRAATAQRLIVAWQQVAKDLPTQAKGLGGILLAAKVEQLMSAASQAALGSDRSAWLSFQDGLEVPILELVNSNRLLSAEDWAKLLGEGIVGLQAVKPSP